MHNLFSMGFQFVLFCGISNCCRSGTNRSIGASPIGRLLVHWVFLMAGDKSNGGAPLSITMTQPAAYWAEC